jgi:Brp/Blh family beta-carotene 15,15'-monooxygenase
MLITAVFILLGVFAAGFVARCEPFLVLGLMLLIGLPHGATDHGLFLQLQGKKQTSKKNNFYLIYLGIIGLYAAVWYVFPVVAFAIFMLLSVYHFGQSNWVDVKYKSRLSATMHYLLWGSGILLTPILLHSPEAIMIVHSMTGTELSALPYDSVLLIIGTIAVVNGISILWLTGTKMLDKSRALQEVIAYALLTGVFFTNSLLLGFTVYFVFWHSLTSAHDQFLFFKRRLSPQLRRQLFGEVVMTVVGALVFCLIVWFGPGPEAALQPAIIGGVFIMISLLTMPHMLLVEQLYASWSPVANSPENQAVIRAGKTNKVNQIPSRPNTSSFVSEGAALTH